MHLLSSPPEKPQRSVSRSPATHLPDRQRPLPRMARLTFCPALGLAHSRCSRNHSTQLDQKSRLVSGSTRGLGDGAGSEIRKYKDHRERRVCVLLRDHREWRVCALLRVNGGHGGVWTKPGSVFKTLRAKASTRYSARRPNPQKPRPPWRLLCLCHLPLASSSLQTLSQPLLHHPILCWAVRGTR